MIFCAYERSLMSDASSEYSRLPNLRDLTIETRRALVSDAAGLSQAARVNLAGENSLQEHIADGMIENVIGKFELPLGVATNFKINNRDYLIPMAVEEPSVVAAASHMAKLARNCGGFHANAERPVMRAQIQILDLSDPAEALEKIQNHADQLIAAANDCDPVLVSLGGGCFEIEGHLFRDTPMGNMLVLHLLVDVRDAMGANTVNTMAEKLAPKIEEITQGRVRLRILSNLADLRLVRARVSLDVSLFDGQQINGHELCTGIVEAATLAQIDPYRAATHNKGIMNGIDPVVLATGNDWRAIEAGAHAYAARNGRYTALSTWAITPTGHLKGEIELPMAVGIIGGATKAHPAAQAALELINVGSAGELAEVIASVGLAQNLAALRALADEGIQKGHMRLHARTVAITAGASPDQVSHIAQKMIEHGAINAETARHFLKAQKP
jgi:hydroxymethylglutaryl-CoA reductase